MALSYHKETFPKLPRVEELLCQHEVVIGLHPPPGIANDTHISSAGIFLVQEFLESREDLTFLVTVTNMLRLLLPDIGEMTLHLQQ